MRVTPAIGLNGQVVGWRGRDLIAQPLLNKGTAFSDHERDTFGLRGLLPAKVSTRNGGARALPADAR